MEKKRRKGKERKGTARAHPGLNRLPTGERAL